jgi:hypothetical protein
LDADRVPVVPHAVAEQGWLVKLHWPHTGSAHACVVGPEHAGALVACCVPEVPHPVEPSQLAPANEQGGHTGASHGCVVGPGAQSAALDAVCVPVVLHTVAEQG